MLVNENLAAALAGTAATRSRPVLASTTNGWPSKLSVVPRSTSGVPSDALSLSHLRPVALFHTVAARQNLPLPLLNNTMVVPLTGLERL